MLTVNARNTLKRLVVNNYREIAGEIASSARKVADKIACDGDEYPHVFNLSARDYLPQVEEKFGIVIDGPIVCSPPTGEDVELQQLDHEDWYYSIVFDQINHRVKYYIRIIS